MAPPDCDDRGEIQICRREAGNALVRGARHEEDPGCELRWLEACA